MNNMKLVSYLREESDKFVYYEINEVNEGENAPPKVN